MREIKFRVWCKFHNSWEKHSCLFTLNGEVVHGSVVGEKDHVLMQFTGLLDKNGVEIYEGDVVRIYEHHFSPMDFIVMWSSANHCWWLDSVLKSSEFPTQPLKMFSFSNLNGFESDCEVIGNIMEQKNKPTI